MRAFFAIVVGLALLVCTPFFLFGDQLERIFAGDGAVAWLRSYEGLAWAAAFGLLISDLLMPIPTTAVMAALGIIYGPLVGGLIAAAGSITSGVVGYVLCRKLGRPLAIRLNGADALAEGERLFARAGGWIVAFSRWIPVASEVIACAAGLSRQPFRVFFLALVCGSVPLGFVFSYIGHLGEENPILTLIISALLPLGLWAAARLLIKRG